MFDSSDAVCEIKACLQKTFVYIEAQQAQKAYHMGNECTFHLNSRKWFKKKPINTLKSTLLFRAADNLDIVKFEIEKNQPQCKNQLNGS